MELSQETQRFNTFHKWPLTKPSANELASMGFEHLNNNIVRCVFCNGISQCSEGDLALKIHLDIRQTCCFLLNYDKLKSQNTWCDWSSCLTMDVPENGMSIIWDAARLARDASMRRMYHAL